MDAVIEDADIPEVDGFKVKVALEQAGFRYISYSHSYGGIGPITIQMPPRVSSMTFSLFNDSAAEGGYNINFFQSDRNETVVGLHVLQGQFGVVYQKHDGGLLRPFIIPNVDEADFVDLAREEYGLRPAGLFRSRSKKLQQLGDQLAQAGDFAGALEHYTQATFHAVGVERAAILFKKGLALLDLRRPNEAIPTFQEAIRLDRSHERRAWVVVRDYQARMTRRG
jgi:tetratricopeptide (TPR) repeat protein